MKKKNKNTNNNLTTFIIVAGVIVLIVFTVVITINILPSNESDSYYVKVDEDMSAKIESIDISDGKLTIKTSGEAKEYCAKSTRTAPTKNAICWHKINDNEATISIFEHKKYYVWIKDNEGNISNYVSVNSKEKTELNG